MNAANLYQKAFQSLPDGELNDYYARLGGDLPAIAQLIEQGRDALELLHRAVDCAECDWGPEVDLEVPLPIYSGGRRLAVLALLAAERSFRGGDDRAGLEDLLAVMALGRHVGRGLYVSGLAGFPIEDLAVTKAFEILGRLDPDTRRGFAARLDSLPAFPEFSQAVRAEKAYFQATQHKPIASLNDQDVIPWINHMFGMPAQLPENAQVAESDVPRDDLAARLIRASGGTHSGLLELADEMFAAFDALVAIADGTETDPAQTRAALEEKASANPLLAEQLESFDRMRPLWDRFKNRFASLRARSGAGELPSS